MRYVPFNDLLLATYMALRETRDAEDDTPALPSFVEETPDNSGTTTSFLLPKAHCPSRAVPKSRGATLGAAPDLTRIDHALGERFKQITYRSPLWTCTVGNSL